MTSPAVDSPESMYFTVLGPVRAWRAGIELDLGPPQQRAALALLLAQAGQPVSLGHLVDVLWGEDPPSTAVNVLHRYVGRLRRLFEPDLPVRTPGRWLVPSSGGYRLQVRTESVDLLQFRQRVDQARAAIRAGRPQDALPLLIEALALYQGPSTAAGIDPQVRAHPVFTAIDQEYLAAVGILAEAALDSGHGEPALAPVRRAAVSNPLDEPLQARLMLLLAAGGRQAEALAVYQNVRAQLVAELGLDPGQELRAAHQRVLRQETPPARPVPVGPAQLPSDLPAFTGREAALSRAFALFGDDPPNDDPLGAAPTPASIIVIDGMAGIGKTTLAVHWSHLIADRFPDGQLYVNLRGFDPIGSGLDPAVAVRGFLEALGVSPNQIPAGLDAQAALYRSLVAGRELLVLLDNARDVEQVRPLLPGSTRCLVIVTSRNKLAGLVARDGALPVTLDLLSPSEARAALAARLGAGRVIAEPAAVEDIITACGRLPLALAIVSARARGHPDFPLAALAAELRDTAGSLDAFTDAEAATDARVVFSWSYQALSPDAARLFRLLALHPGPEVTAPAAAALAGVTVRSGRRLLTELARASLLDERLPGRYTAHDLLRAYAGEQLAQVESDSGQDSARHRVLDYYLRTAFAANRLMEPNRDAIELPPITSGVPPADRLPDADAAQAWFAAEFAVLLATVRQAAEQGYETHSWQLTWAMQQFFDRCGHWHDWVAVMLVALTAAQGRDDPIGIAHSRRALGTVYNRLGRETEADRELNRALGLFEELGEESLQAHLHLVLSAVKSRSPQRHEPGHRHSRHEQAREHGRRALELYVATGSRVGQARALNNLGFASARLGDHTSALEFCQAALDLQQDLDDRHGQAGAWDSVALAHHHLGHYQQSVACYHQALDLFTGLGNRYFAANTMIRLGDVHYDNGRFEQARHHWEEALNVLSDLDHADAGRVRRKLLELADTSAATITSAERTPSSPGRADQSSGQSTDARKSKAESRDS